MGLASGVAYFYIVYLVWFGEVNTLAKNSGPVVARANKALGWFVLAGWSIYPLGYIAGTAGGLFGVRVLEGLSLDAVYNLGDAINKIGFGLVIYALAQSDKPSIEYQHQNLLTQTGNSIIKNKFQLAGECMTLCLTFARCY